MLVEWNFKFLRLLRLDGNQLCYLRFYFVEINTWNSRRAFFAIPLNYVKSLMLGKTENPHKFCWCFYLIAGVSSLCSRLQEVIINSVAARLAVHHHFYFHVEIKGNCWVALFPIAHKLFSAHKIYDDLIGEIRSHNSVVSNFRVPQNFR